MEGPDAGRLRAGPRVTVMATDDVDLPRIGAPATRALVGAGYTSVGQLDGVPAAELSALHGFGPKALRILQEALEAEGRSLG